MFFSEKTRMIMRNDLQLKRRYGKVKTEKQSAENGMAAAIRLLLQSYHYVWKG